MKLSFFGAAHAVTGSCHCLEVGGKKSSSTAACSRAGMSTTTTLWTSPPATSTMLSLPTPTSTLRSNSPAGEGGVPGADLYHPAYG